jgi:hypothetical protein
MKSLMGVPIFEHNRRVLLLPFLFIFGIFFAEQKMSYIFALSFWGFSSAGSEHLPYKQRVGGSNPSTPTTENR